MEYAAIVLAAGFSRRFGSDKRLASVDGRPMLLKSLEPVCQLVDAGILKQAQVVLRARDPLVRAMLGRLPIMATHADPWPVGPGASLASAVARLPAEISAVLIGYGDMPFIQASTMMDLLSACHQNRMVVPVFNQQRGFPMVVGRDLLSALVGMPHRCLPGYLAKQAPDLVDEVPVSDPGVLLDIDRPWEFYLATRPDQVGKTPEVIHTVPVVATSGDSG